MALLSCAPDMEKQFMLFVHELFDLLSDDGWVH